MAALAAYIWTRDDSWRLVAPEAPALLLVFPAFYLLGRPWSLDREAAGGEISSWLPAATAALLVAGVAIQSTLVLALGWSCLLRIVLARSGVRTAHPDPTSLHVLVAAGFPWLATDLAGMAWPLRTTAASTVATVLSGLGLDAAAEGPLIHVHGIALSVDASCSGMGAMQACLLLAAFLQAQPGSTRRSPLTLIVAVFSLAYLANLARLLGLAAVALTLGVPAARGPLHSITGLLALAIPAMALMALIALPRREG